MSLARPTSYRPLMNGFCWYARRMIRSHFHVFAADLSAFDYQSVTRHAPLVVFSNHPGWWDPIVGMLLCREYFKDRIFFAPIDAVALKKYRIFEKLGYFGIQANTRRGASDFIELASHVLGSGTGSLWITPEGRFTDVRDHRQPLMPGLAHLATKIPNVHCIPLAIEYVFSDERRPFLLCRLGPSLTGSDSSRRSKAEWQARLTEHLRQTQTALAEAVISRQWDAFDVVVRSAQRLPHGVSFRQRQADE